VRILFGRKGITAATLISGAAIAGFAQHQPVLTGAAAYGDWRGDAPGVRRKITPADLLPPHQTASARDWPTAVARPAKAWPQAPPGFRVELLGSGPANPRLIRVSPNGEVFVVAESEPGRIRVLPAAEGNGTIWRITYLGR
jgi:glucose/arabinose dehydrogenase